MILFLLNGISRPLRKSREEHEADLPGVSLIIPAFNEASVLREKISNTLDIDYPAGKLTVIFITDGSTDNSPELLRAHPSILTLHEVGRRGKTSALRRAMEFVKTPIVVFSDANSMLNRECLLRIVRHYANDRVGGVAGEKKILSAGSPAVGQAEGLYWKYESFMKRQDAAFNTVVGAAGELFSIRTDLFTPPGDEVVLDDFVISMNICLGGHRIAYEPGAFATELPSASLMEEEKRKVRISAGAYQSVGILHAALNFFRFPLLSFQYISRRVLRWMVCPFLLPVLVVTNIFLYQTQPSQQLYAALLLAQLVFYLSAAVGWLLLRSGRRGGLLSIPAYFLFMNYCLIKGLLRYLRKKQEVTWEKSQRA